MAALIGSGVSLRGITDPSDFYPFNVSGGATNADVTKGVQLDTTLANTVKLATDGAYIVGRLETCEVRTIEGISVGTVNIGGAVDLPLSSANSAQVGDHVVGGGGGTVRKGVTADAGFIAASGSNIVVEVSADGLTATVLFK